jgi:nicotinate-nucleotide adenylyltransferase
MRIGVLGGSFDPVHNAHLIVARLACEQLQLDRVLFMVAAGQPLKQAHHATGPQRLRMAELAVAGIPDFSADDRELRRPAPSYTIDTLQDLAVEMPGAELVLIMGTDVARRLAEWRDPAGIRSLARIAVCQRPMPDGESVAPAGFDLDVVVPAIEISSSAVRARARAGLPLAGWVPAAVADYIVASQLYVE